MTSRHDADTAEHPVASPVPDVAQPTDASSRAQVDLAALSHRGLVRSNNEDHYLIVRGERALHTVMTNLPPGCLPERFGEVVYSLLVADGMGGMAAGEVASQTAIITLVNLFLNAPAWTMRLGERGAEELMQRMADRYRQIDAVLRDHADRDPNLSGMGTTMTLAMSFGPDLILTHIGDSRAYVLRAGQLHQLTRDQTLAQALADRGVISQEETATHGLRHVLTSALGGGDANTEPQVQHVRLRSDDQLLLCTDGLSDIVDDATIGEILRCAGTPEDACAALIQAALHNGGKDNVTVALARYHFAESE
jgi:protein phosphatase